MARAEIDEVKLAGLTQNMKSLGLLRPLAVREREGYYEIIDGHRRYLAALRLGLMTLRCLVLGPQDANDAAVKLNSNLWAQDMNPVEEAGFFVAIMPDYGDDTDKLAAGLGLTRDYVEKRLLLLKGDQDILEAVAHHRLGMGVAGILNQIPDKGWRDYYREWAIKTGCTIQMAKAWLQSALAQISNSPLENMGPPQQAFVPAPTRDILVCLDCGEKEPVTDLEFWHVHRGCRLRMERVCAALGIDPEAAMLPQLEVLAAQLRQIERNSAAAVKT
jgi:ParB family chromosome partitioning protein